MSTARFPALLPRRVPSESLAGRRSDSQGNSGGAVVDSQGRVIGISEAYIPPQQGAVAIGIRHSGSDRRGRGGRTTTARQGRACVHRNPAGGADARGRAAASRRPVDRSPGLCGRAARPRGSRRRRAWGVCSSRWQESRSIASRIYSWRCVTTVPARRSRSSSCEAVGATPSRFTCPQDRASGAERSSRRTPRAR